MTIKKILNFYQTTKPGIVRMNLITVSIGFYLGSLGEFYNFKSYIFLLIGTWLVASSCGMFNSYYEVDVIQKWIEPRIVLCR